MSLQKQLVHLNMSGGLQKKDDQFLVIPSKLAVADNVEFDDASTVIRRGGQRKFPTVTGAPYTTAQRVFRHGGRPVIEFQDGSMLRANGQSTYPSDFGQNGSAYGTNSNPITFARIAAQTKRLLGQYTDFDIALGTTTYCIAFSFQDLTAALPWGVRLSIRDINTDVEIQSLTIPVANASEVISQPRIIYDSTNDRYGIFTYHEDTAFVTASMKASYVSAAGGGALTGPSVVISMASGAIFTPMTDAAIVQGQGYCVCSRDAASGTVRLRLLSLSMAASIATVGLVPAVNPVSLTAHATFSAGVLTGHALYGAGASVKGLRVPSNTGIISAEATISTVVGSLIGRIAVADSAVAGSFQVICDTFFTTTSTNPSTYLIVATTAHVFVNRTAISTNCFIAGRIFSMRGRNYIPVAFESVWYQGTLFLLDLSDALRNVAITTPAVPLFAARLSYGEAAYSGMSSTAGTARRVASAFGSLTPYFRYETDLRIAGTTNVTPICISAAVFDPASQLADVDVNGLTFLAGAMPMLCDGFQIVEEGFHWGPEVVGNALTPVATGSGVYSFPNTTGTYSIAFTEAWQDAEGNWHESAVAHTHTLTITAGSGLLDINPTFIRPPSMKLGRTLVMYRTLRSSTDTSMYLAHTGDLAGSHTVVLDADLPSSEQLYTAGNVLPNTPAPACRHVSLFQKRLVLSGCGDGSRIYYSKPIDTGFGVEFSSGDPSHQGLAPPSAGRVVGTCELDDNLVVLCEDAIGVIAGSGPSPTGLQGEYSTFGTRSANLGADWNSPKSILRAPEGVWFRSPYGLRFFARQGQIQVNDDGKQMGADVDPLVSGNVVAIAGGAKQQARFYQSSGTCLVYDYQWKQWTRFTGMSSVDAVYADGRYYHLSNVGSTPLLRYTDDTYDFDDDDTGALGQQFYGYIETPWLSFAGLQGFQRIYRLLVLARAPNGTGNHTINGFVGYNFADSASPPTTETFTAGIVALGPNNQIQIQHHFAKQKCESLKLGIQFRPLYAGGTGRLRITDLTLQVGAKAGYFKMPSSARY